MLYPKQSFVRLPVNTAGRDFFFGDLHGCLAHLKSLMAAVDFNPEADRLFSVGDLIDHGPSSFETLQCLAEWPYFYAVLGNHEAMALGTLGIVSMFWYGAWDYNGGHWADDLTREQALCLRDTLQGLPLAMEIPLPDGRRVGMVHAEVRHTDGWDGVKSVAMTEVIGDDDESRRKETALLWSRSQAAAAFAVNRRLERTSSWTREQRKYVLERLRHTPGIDLIIAGHTIIPEHQPLWVENRLMIDTGAHQADGCLTLVEPLSNQYWQVGWDETGKTPSAHVICQTLPLPLTVRKAARLLRTAR